MNFKYPLQIIDESTVRLWVKLDRNFDLVSLSNIDTFTDLYPEHHFAYWVQESGLNELIDHPSSPIVVPGTDHKIYLRNELWALHNGIIPQQPFRIEVTLWSEECHTQDGTEYDSGADAEILEIKPTTHAATFWAKWQKQQERFMIGLAKEIHQAESIVFSHLGGLAIREDSYYASGWDEMAMPDGLRFTLYSRIEPVDKDGRRLLLSHQLGTSGQSKHGKPEEALIDLKANIAKHYPQFKEIPIELLPRNTRTLPTIRIQAN